MAVTRKGRRLPPRAGQGRACSAQHGVRECRGSSSSALKNYPER